MNLPGTYRIKDGIVALALNHNKAVIFDETDLEKVRKYNWYAHSRKGTDLWSICTVVKYFDETQGLIKKRSIYLPRYITDCPIGKYVIMKDGNTFNNRRENLIVADKAFRNASVLRNRRGMLGITRLNNGKYFTRINYNGKYYCGGTYSNVFEASIAYDILSLKLRGPNAIINNEKMRAELLDRLDEFKLPVEAEAS